VEGTSSQDWTGLTANFATGENPVHELRSDNNLSILYYSARSLLPKIDHLSSLCLASDPDIVCIVESWLCNEITDSEIALPGYSPVRLDRNRYGGCVLLYNY